MSVKHNIEVIPPGGRLFMVVTRGSKKPHEDRYFGTKKEAKFWRDELNGKKVGDKIEGKKGEEDRVVGCNDLMFVVTEGPDHRNFN